MTCIVDDMKACGLMVGGVVEQGPGRAPGRRQRVGGSS